MGTQDAQPRSLVLRAEQHCDVAVVAIGCSDGRLVLSRFQLDTAAGAQQHASQNGSTPHGSLNGSTCQVRPAW